MSALGHKQTLKRFHPMSALPPKADIGTQSRNVRFVPLTDIRGSASSFTDRSYINRVARDGQVRWNSVRAGDRRRLVQINDRHE